MAWISAIIGVIGAGASASGAKDAANAASGGSKKALQFSMYQYQQWQSIYGDLQENLSDYYNSITPSKYAAANLTAYEKEFATASKNVRESFAQRGIEDSGMAVAAESSMLLSKAKARTDIRSDAEKQVQQEKLNFLTLGMGHNPVSQVQSALNQNATALQAISANAQAQAGEAIAGATELVGTALTDSYDQYKKDQAANSLLQVKE